MNVERAVDMKKKWESGMTHQQIADIYGVSRACVSDTIKRVNLKQSLDTRGRKLDLEKIKYKHIYDYFKKNVDETCTSLTRKVYGHAQASSVIKLRNFLYGWHDVKFTTDQIRMLCVTIGKPFEELLEER